jgi:asparagine synthase (glutamine-hydrolysing)
VLPQLAWAYDEPFADPSMLPTYYVSKLAREHVTVVLTGDGGDEIFGGYARYERELSNYRIPSFMRFLLSHGAMFIPDGMRGKRRLRNMRYNLAARYIQYTMSFPDDSRSSMYLPEHFARVRNHDPYKWQSKEFQIASYLDVAAQMQYVDVRTYLADDILVKVDKASMFNSLETRAPLLDHYLAEYVSSLPSKLRMRDGALKYLLKKVAVNMLPAQILERPKQGFGVPIKYWLRSDLASYTYDLLDSPKAQQRGIFDPHYIRNLLKAHTRSKQTNYSEGIWTLLCLEHWFQVYMDEPSFSDDQYASVQITSNR